MAGGRRTFKFKDGYSLRDLARTVAEQDAYLAQYYIGRDRYVDRALSREDDASVFIGPKGVGKSAILQMVRLSQAASGNASRVIEISPDDLSFNALVNIEVRSPILQQPGKNQWLFTSLWDYVLAVELLKLEMPNHDGISGFLTQLFRGRHVKEQKQLLSLTLRDDGTQLTLTDKMLSLVDAIEAQASISGVSANARLEKAEGSNRHQDLALLQLIGSVAKSLPQTLKHEYYILIDDLDLHWTGSDLQSAFIGAMFFSIRKLSRTEKLKFVVSLRESIYCNVALEERDKFEPYTCRVQWDKEAVVSMIKQRIAYVMSLTPEAVESKLFPPDGLSELWKNTSGMPRDMLRIAICVLDCSIRNGSRTVTHEDISEGIRNFSQSRLLDLASEYMHIYPRMNVVTKFFVGKKREFDIETLREVAFDLNEAVINSASAADLAWATLGVEDPVGFGRSLLRTGFLLLKDGRSARERVATEDDMAALDDKKWYSVHPMYISGLGIDGAA